MTQSFVLVLVFMLAPVPVGGASASGVSGAEKATTRSLKSDNRKTKNRSQLDCDRQNFAALRKSLRSLGKSKNLDGSGIAISGEFCHVR